MAQNILGKKLRAARLKKGLQQDQVGVALGVSAQAVSQWETGKTTPDIGRLSLIANLLDVDAKWLLAEDAGDLGADAPVVVPSPTAAIYGARTPVIELRDAAYFSLWIMKTFEPPKSSRTVEPTHPARGPSFAFEITDDSMAPEFNIGDLVVIDCGIMPATGDYAVAFFLTDHENPLFRKFQFEGLDEQKRMPVISLIPLNGAWPVEVITFYELANPGLTVGTMVEHRRFAKDVVKRLNLPPTARKALRGRPRRTKAD